MEEEDQMVPGVLDACSICFEALDMNDKKAPVVVIKSCGHPFHKECITSWLSDRSRVAHPRCPGCQKPAAVEELIQINHDFPVADDQRPIYQQIRERLRIVTREIHELGQLGSAEDMERQRNRLLRDRDALLVLERRNRLLNEIVVRSNNSGAADATAGVRTQQGDRSVLLQLSEELDEEHRKQEAAAAAQRERMMEVTATQHSTEDALKQMKRAVERKKQSVGAGRYEELKQRAAQRRQRTNSAAAADSAANVKRRENSAAAEKRKPRFGATKEERQIKSSRISQWMQELREPSPITEVKIEPEEAQQMEDDAADLVDHRTFHRASKAAAASATREEIISRRKKAASG